MDVGYRHILTETLLQTRRRRLDYYSYFFYGILAICICIGGSIGMYYWNAYSPQIRRKHQQEQLRLMTFRNTMRKHNIK